MASWYLTLKYIDPTNHSYDMVELVSTKYWRLSLSCGHVGCFDFSRNKHATKHFNPTTHPIIRSFEEWCHVDNVII